MPSIQVREIRIPSAIPRERRPSVLYTVLKSTFTALLLALICFFFLNACAIAGLALTEAVRHRSLDFASAYRDFAAPSAAGIFVILWIGALIFFFRERSR
jgi:Mn2+/Fe2+ NRAMP family transporter